MPFKRKSAGAKMAAESSVTPSKGLRASLSGNQPSGDSDSEVRGFPEANCQNPPQLMAWIHMDGTNTEWWDRSLARPRRERRGSGVALARTLWSQLQSQWWTDPSVDVDVPERLFPEKKPPLLLLPPQRHPLFQSEDVGDLPRGLVLSHESFRWGKWLILFSRDRDSSQTNTYTKEEGRPWTAAQESACQRRC